MNRRKKSILESVDQRIAFYQRSMVWIFILGLLSGTGILCGKSTFIAAGLSYQQQFGIKIALCFCIAVTGIATGSAYRRRIRHLKEHRNKIFMDFYQGQAFLKPPREQTISEVQALFGFLLILVAAVTFIHYPIPGLPAPFDNVPVRLIPIAGFVGLCWVSVSFERKKPLALINPLQDFVQRQQKQARKQYSQQSLSHAYLASGTDFRKTGVARIPTNQPM